MGMGCRMTGLALLLLYGAAGAAQLPVPEQLHLAFTNKTDEMLVQWAVEQGEDYPQAVVRYRVAGTKDWAEAPSEVTLPGPGSYQNYRTTLRKLQLNAKYDYAVGWHGEEASFVQSHFTALDRRDTSHAPRMAFFADLGWTDDQVRPFLEEESAAGALDAIVMFGDFVYQDGGVGKKNHENAWMRDVSRFAGNGSVPIMVSPGNADFTHDTDRGPGFYRYSTQFAMPGWETTDSLWHSFDIGPAHIVGINTELIEWGVPLPEKLDEMKAWLHDDLKAAAANRANVPWIFVHYHRPSYSTGNTDDIPYKKFEPLMYKYGVDVVFAGHVHNQEYTLPVFNKTVMSGPDPARPYHNARAPTYVISGNPGNDEETNYFARGFDPWTAWRAYHYGYSVVTVTNETSMKIEFVSTQLGGQVTTAFELSKDVSCNFGDFCTHQPQAPPPSRPAPRSILAGAAVMKARNQRNAGNEAVPALQVKALQNFYKATQGEGWKNNANWMNGADPCSADAPWYGVTCIAVTERTMLHLATSYGITAVQIPSNNLRGTIPDEFGLALADTIQLIDISQNFLTGALPMTLLQGLPKLHTLYVEPATDEAAYRLTGTLPDDLGLATGLPNLRFLGLNRNALTGAIPGSLGALSCHETGATADMKKFPDYPTLGGEVACNVWLEGNNFTGAIPIELCNATYLELFFLDNPLTCPKGSPPCIDVLYKHWPEGCRNNCTPCP